jgi:hypothetical protein
MGPTASYRIPEVTENNFVGEANNMSDDTSSATDLKTLLALVLGTPAVMIAIAVLIEPQHRTAGSVVGLIVGLAIGGSIASFVEERNQALAHQASAKVAQEQIEGKIDQKTASTVDIAVLNMRKLDEYYALNKQQAKRSFNISIGAVVVGFATLIFAVRFVPDSSGKFAGGLAGVLLQFIGGGFFYLYNKSLDQLNLFYGKLISLQNTMLALQLCEKLTTSKEETTKTIALELMRRSEAVSGVIQTKSERHPRHPKAPRVESSDAATPRS